MMANKTNIKAVLIDLSGTLHVDDEPTANAVQALKRLRSFNHIQLRFVTNTTKESKMTLLKRLHQMGFTSIDKDDMFTSLSAAVQYVRSRNLHPFYLLTEDAKTDFFASNENCATPISDETAENCVVVGLAPEKFTYEHLNRAFRLLMNENSTLVAVHEGKYFKRSDGLAVGPGCFTHGLEYATGKKAVVIGKPNSYFFNCAIPDGITPNECCMIGDDIVDDIAGAINVGMKGILVKTGKYIENIENTSLTKPTNVINCFADVVEWLINKNFTI